MHVQKGAWGEVRAEEFRGNRLKEETYLEGGPPSDGGDAGEHGQGAEDESNDELTVDHRVAHGDEQHDERRDEDAVQLVPDAEA